MDLLPSLRVSARQLCKRLSVFGLPLILLGCAAAPAQQPQTPSVEQPQQQIETKAVATEIQTVDEATPSLPMSPELVYYILTAEIAGQRGEMAIAVDLYHRASELVDSPRLASRSAQVATYSRDQQRINRALDRWLEVEPNAADVHVMRVPFLILKGDFDGVAAAIDRAITLEPEKGPSYLVRLSESLSELANPEQSMQVFERLQCFKENQAFAKFAYARLAAFYKFYDKALVELDALQKQDANNEEYLVLRADILQRTNRSDEALRLIEKAAKKESASDDLRFSYGKLLGEAGKTDTAREVFEALQSKNPENRDVLYALGLLAMEDKNPTLAKDYFSQLLKVGDPSHQTEYFMGLAEESLGNVDSALVWFASVPMQSHRFDMAQTHYINLLAGRGEIDKARAHMALLRKENPQHAVQYYLFESGFLRDHGMDHEAFDLLTHALETKPDNNDLLYGRAMVAEPLGKLDVLEADLRNILGREPNNAQALNALGYTLADRTDRHQEALKLIEKALEIQPNDPFYLDSLGWVYYRLGDLQKAELYLQQSVDIQADAEFMAHLGEVLWQRGKQPEARKVWQDGLKLNPENKLLLETMHRFGQ